MRFLGIGQLTKQNYDKNNAIDYAKTDCCICDFKLSLGSFFGPDSKKKKKTYLDFIIKKSTYFMQYISSRYPKKYRPNKSNKQVLCQFLKNA